MDFESSREGERLIQANWYQRLETPFFIKTLYVLLQNQTKQPIIIQWLFCGMKGYRKKLRSYTNFSAVNLYIYQ